ncbi:DUF5977 domain-containing protein [Mucilaginibacter gotjawali]|uniref:Uncharacterized protein n=2 Tax=Mucilaginibacter gotjawali TaxID=1550579 RepID=A0A839SL59_9SPHI|nr:DUF5977 domain-containing protein [Mucilaginibacter gotjawali]MBB3058262.1 hypothetical protein [Mucilaginibacter gotjawali]BAU55620.1 hypothetical protein MgSA37_03811 [Mucilaginibacter gotjawali]
MKLIKLKPFLLSFLTVASCFLPSHLKAQSGTQINYFVPQPFPRSPTATAIEKYGTYQVNEFTGIPDISIPLYTIEAGGFQVPITLSYHASGNKVTDVASWAGLGWSVSGAGQITRRTYGLPDDMPYGCLNGYVWQNSAINTSTYAGVYYLEKASDGTYDTKPDIFSYDFPGHGGKFFIYDSVGTYKVKMLPYAPLKINYNLVAYSYSNPPPNTGLTRFTIADEHGNNYTFGDASTETTYSSTSGHTGSTSASAWKLENMISQNRRDTVSFSYQNDAIIYPSADGEIYSVIDQIVGTGYHNASYSSTPTTPGNYNSTSEKLVSQITFKNGKVVFDLDASSRQDINVGSGSYAYGLKDIKVYKYNFGTKAMELQKTIVFYKSYFNSGGNQRLRLDSIQILDKAGSIVQHYRFGYNTSISLPAYTSYQQDYWGFYNGKANSMLTPQQTISYQPVSGGSTSYVTIGSSVANGRNCDSNYMQAFVLDTIRYPTGGYSTFTYQTNQYYSGSTLMLAGGLRVKTISSYDGINPTPIVKTYIYNSARANFLLDYGYFSTQQTHRLYGSSPISTEIVRTYSNNPHCDLEGYDGATVVYPSVTEYIGTPGTNVGRTDYTFTDQQDAYTSASMSGNLIYISAFYVRGHLLTKNEYIHLSGGGYQIVKSTSNSYTAFPYTSYSYVGLAVRKLFYNEGAPNPISPGTQSPDDTNSFLYPNYYITSDDNYLTGTTVNYYDTNNPANYTTSTTTYKYDNLIHQQVTRSYHTDSKGNTLVSVSKYPADYPSGNAVIDTMVSRNMQAEAIEKYDTLKNVTTGVNAVASGELTTYKFGTNNAAVLSTIKTLRVALPLTSFSPSTITSGSLTNDTHYEQVISFDNYDSNNNLTQFTPRNTTPVSIFWGYLGESPIAQVKDAISTNAAYTSFEFGGSPSNNWYYSGTPVTDLTAPTGSLVYPLSSGSISASVSSGVGYTLSYWSNGGAATVYAGGYLTGTALTSINGWTYYEYLIPTSVTTVSISGSVSIDELRLYPSAAQMTTYAYDPSGVRSISDTKGLNNYFEYDFAQRLKNIKNFYGYIVNNYGYHTYDQTIGNQLQSAVFTRNNCPPNTTPGSLTYTVPINRYYSSTQVSANADATYDMNVNGQAKANQYCGCPVITTSFTLSNSTGLTGFQATFSGIATPYNFPSSGSTVINVPVGTYATISVNAVGSGTHTFTLTGYTPVVAHSASFSSVAVTSGSNLTLSIQ